MENEKQSVWAIVELFGHQRIAGLLSEYVVGGQSFVRVDVPEVFSVDGSEREGPIAAHTKLFGAGAIYAINFVDEKLARHTAQQIRHQPVSVYEARDFLRSLRPEDRQRLLEAPDRDGVHG